MAPVSLYSRHLVGNTRNDSHADRGGREEKLVSGLLETIMSDRFHKGVMYKSLTSSCGLELSGQVALGLILALMPAMTGLTRLGT